MSLTLLAMNLVLYIKFIPLSSEEEALELPAFMQRELPNVRAEKVPRSHMIRCLLRILTTP